MKIAYALLLVASLLGCQANPIQGDITITSPEKQHRLAQVYTANKQDQTVVMENPPLGDYLSDPAIYNGVGD